VEVTFSLTGLSNSVIFLVHVEITVSSEIPLSADLANDVAGMITGFRELVRRKPLERTRLLINTAIVIERSDVGIWQFRELNSELKRNDGVPHVRLIVSRFIPFLLNWLGPGLLIPIRNSSSNSTLTNIPERLDFGSVRLLVTKHMTH
jgi:hypothetical protein